MNEKDEAEVRIVPAKVRSDTGVTSVVAETGSTEAEDIEESDDEDVARVEKGLENDEGRPRRRFNMAPSVIRSDP